MERETARCTGHCCRAFILPQGPDELAWQPALHQLAEKNEPRPRDARFFKDGAQIARMVVYLGAWLMGDEPESFGWPWGAQMRELRKEGGARLEQAEKNRIATGAFHWYTCRNLLPNGNCGVYNRRPSMCREYPYGRAAGCQYTACTRKCERVPLDLNEVRVSISAPQ